MTADSSLATESPAQGFNALRDPWIQVTMCDGTQGELSLLGLFDRAADVERLAGDSGVFDGSAIRLVQAIAIRAVMTRALPEISAHGVDVTPEGLWEYVRDAGPVALSDWVHDYLTAYEGRFLPWSSGAPAWQEGFYHGEADDGDRPSTAAIVPGMPTNDRAHHSVRTSDGVRRLTMAEATRGILAVQTYDTSGLKSGIDGGPRPSKATWGTQFLQAWPEGPTLYDTILLNLVLCDPADESRLAPADDLPWWELPPREDHLPALVRPTGVVSLLTVRGRRVKTTVDRDGMVVGVMLGAGDAVISKSTDKAGLRRMASLEPMCFRVSDTTVKKTDVFVPAKSGTVASRMGGLVSLISPEDVERDPSGPALLRPPATVEWIRRLARHVGAGVLPGEVTVRTLEVRTVSQGACMGEIRERELFFPGWLLSSESLEDGEAACAAADGLRSALEGFCSAVSALVNLRWRATGVHDLRVASDAKEAALRETLLVLSRCDGPEALSEALPGLRLWLVSYLCDEERVALREAHPRSRRGWRLSRDTPSGKASWDGTCWQAARAYRAALKAIFGDDLVSQAVRATDGQGADESASE